eukprot:COSAG02_NODE_4521_length_5267_cov_8.795666_2_plen_86_part_00
MTPVPLYQPFVSSAKHKKYSVYVLRDGRRRLIHFGDRRYQHFHDKLNNFSHLDHNDSRRRELWYARHGRSSDKSSARYWAARVLW